MINLLKLHTPYFNLVLKDSRIIEYKDFIILEIGLINIGKETATNIKLVRKDNSTSYLKLSEYSKSKYEDYRYLSQYYARVGEEVTFKSKFIGSKDVSDQLTFTIGYYNLIGDYYEQDFDLIFYNMYGSYLYSLNNNSYPPKLIYDKKH